MDPAEGDPLGFGAGAAVGKASHKVTDPSKAFDADDLLASDR
jgi:hypothetical protein